MAVNATIKVEGVSKVREFLSLMPEEIKLAQKRALNKAAVQSRNQIVRRLEINLPAKRKKLAVRPRKATRRKLESRITSFYERTPATWFTGWVAVRGRTQQRVKGSKELKRVSKNQGFRVRYYKGDEPSRYPHGFIWRQPGGARAFQRAVVGGQRVGRLPIRQIYGPSVYQEFLDQIAFNGDASSALYTRLLEHEINHILRNVG